ncbi:pH-response regulator [Colletotrichum orchidophilum]|uniref:pH-response regulator n=1 Tax=Colletotrichum orchidophilum TaxID=1209926 RepID=A0A1G4BN69_9PEZI|nr:pH-response regulator [Colletotrichum orchidophilum]OHF02910.1 pH-response regulator [Colletotrichum orchidophilum]
MFVGSLGLLILTCVSVPNTSLSLFTMEAARSGACGSSGPSIVVDFGLWGWCQTTAAEWTRYPQGCLRVRGSPGYDPAAIIRPMISQFPSSIKSRGMRDLTLGFALPAVATATASLGFLSTLAGLVKYNRFTTLASAIRAALSFLFAVAALRCVFSLFEKIRRELPRSTVLRLATNSRDMYDISTKYGASSWTLVAACAILLIGTTALIFAWLAEVRENRRKWSDDVREKSSSSPSEGRPSGAGN